MKHFCCIAYYIYAIAVFQIADLWMRIRIENWSHVEQSKWKEDDDQRRSKMPIDLKLIKKHLNKLSFGEGWSFIIDVVLYKPEEGPDSLYFSAFPILAIFNYTAINS